MHYSDSYYDTFSLEKKIDEICNLSHFDRMEMVIH